MRPLLTVMMACFVVGIAMPARAQETMPVALTGKMQPFSYLFGNPWSCTTNVPAMGNMPAHTDQGPAVFQAGPGNTVHGHVSTPNFMGDYYYGYSDRSNMYWETSADNMGGYGFRTSTDGKTYSGNTSMGPMTAPTTITYAKVTDERVTIHEVVSAAGQQSVFDSVCTR